MVFKLDRLGRSLRDLVETVNLLRQRGVALRSLHEATESTTPAGKLTFHIFAALEEFEAAVIRDRTQAGLQAARHRGAKLGRPRTLTPEQIEIAWTLLDNPRFSSRQVAEQLGVHRFTLYRSLRSQVGGPEPAL